jgi:hypothetical protein
MLTHAPYTITPTEDHEWVLFSVYNEDTGTYSSKTVRLKDVPRLIREASRGGGQRSRG